MAIRFGLEDQQHFKVEPQSRNGPKALTGVQGGMRSLGTSFTDPPHLFPGVSLIYDLAHDSGMLQSELFTSRYQNLVLAKLPNLGFWRYGQFFK